MISDINRPVLQLRVALTTSDYERLVKFYCDGLGMEPAAAWNNDGGRALMLEMGQAALELFDERQAEVIDELEAGKRVSGQVRFALQVPDTSSPRWSGRWRTARRWCIRLLSRHGAMSTRASRIPTGCRSLYLKRPILPQNEMTAIPNPDLIYDLFGVMAMAFGSDSCSEIGGGASNTLPFGSPIVMILGVIAAAILFGLNKRWQFWVGSLAVSAALGLCGYVSWFMLVSQRCG